VVGLQLTAELYFRRLVGLIFGLVIGLVCFFVLGLLVGEGVGFKFLHISTQASAVSPINVIISCTVLHAEE
jgi:hypothetical protein